MFTTAPHSLVPLCSMALGPLHSFARRRRRHKVGRTKRVRAVRVPNGSICGRRQARRGATGSRPSARRPLRADAAARRRPGAPTSHQSEVRFLYDDENLYIGATFHEDEIDKLVTNDLRRDFPGARDGDLYVVILDTFHDQLNAYNFQTNPGCALRDSQSLRRWPEHQRELGRRVDVPIVGERHGVVRRGVGPVQAAALPAAGRAGVGRQHVPPDSPQQRADASGIRRRASSISSRRRTPACSKASAASIQGATSASSHSSPGRRGAGVGVYRQQRRRRSRRQDRSRHQSRPRRHLADRLLAGRSRRAAGEPHALQPLLSREARVLPREPGRVSDRPARRLHRQPNFVPFFSRTIGLSDTATRFPSSAALRLTGKVGRNSIAAAQHAGRPAGAGGLASPRQPPCRRSSANYSVVRYGREFLSNSQAGLFVPRQGARRLFEPSCRRRTCGSIRPATLNIDALFMRLRSRRRRRWQRLARRQRSTTRAVRCTCSTTHRSASTFSDELGLHPAAGRQHPQRRPDAPASVRSTLAPRVREIRPELPYHALHPRRAQPV